MFHQKCECAVNITTVAAAKVRKTCRTKADKLRNPVVVRIDEVTSVFVRCVRSAVRVHVDDAHHAVVGLIHLNSELDSRNLAIVRHLANRIICAARSTGIIADNATEGCVSNQREAVCCASDAIDRGNQVIKHCLCNRTRRANACSRSAIGSRNVRWASGVNPVAKATQTVDGATTIFDRAVIVGHQSSFDVALDFTDGFRLRLGNLRWANRVNSVLKVRHHEVTAELLNIVAKASAASKLVGEGSDIRTFRNTRCDGSRKAVHCPLNESGGGFGFRGGRQHRSFLWCKNRQYVKQVLAV